ncbi:HK97-gp10 family putative phage morphogenesis protein [Schauerella aestuarii]|uniref:HK97-gp10 family putative phage morphogenesis protein n=1 Tax=Schauerella aestuarii TaxID=2511204 RepID=UPI00136F0EDC|nr:HK97-gp10 family putative phage morphogenesis protein [Achromobacter aestuarii]MYZ41418.1 hypothetical protein [Achromobacter aestuarii]
MKVEVKLQGADGLLGMLQSMPAEVVSKRGGPVKLALAKGARIIRDEARKNVKVAVAQNGSLESTGLLEKNVIASRGKAPSGGKGERYLVRVKRKTYPKLRGKKPTTTLQTANLMEYGSSHQPATPWLRPAVQLKGQQAIETIVSDLSKRIEKVAAQLAKEKGMK